MPPYYEPQPSDGPRWDWVMDARAAASEHDTPEPEPGAVFSTFDGEPPEVWPTLTSEPPTASAGGAGGGGGRLRWPHSFAWLALLRWWSRRLRF